MIDSALEARLRELVDKNDIRDVLWRYVRGADRGDRAPILDAFHPDATFDIGKRPAELGPEPPGAVIRNRMVGTRRPPDLPAGFTRMSPSDAADAALTDDHVRTHFYGQTLIEFEGDLAYSETYFMAFNVEDRGGQQFIRTRSSRAIDRWERREGAWKILNRIVVDDWSRADLVVEPDRAAKISGSRSGDDAVYRIRVDPSK